MYTPGIFLQAFVGLASCFLFVWPSYLISGRAHLLRTLSQLHCTHVPYMNLPQLSSIEIVIRHICVHIYTCICIYSICLHCVVLIMKGLDGLSNESSVSYSVHTCTG